MKVESESSKVEIKCVRVKRTDGQTERRFYSATVEQVGYLVWWLECWRVLSLKQRTTFNRCCTPTINESCWQIGEGSRLVTLLSFDGGTVSFLVLLIGKSYMCSLAPLTSLTAMFLRSFSSLAKM